MSAEIIKSIINEMGKINNMQGGTKESEIKNRVIDNIVLCKMWPNNLDKKNANDVIEISVQNTGIIFCTKRLITTVERRAFQRKLDSSISQWGVLTTGIKYYVFKKRKEEISPYDSLWKQEHEILEIDISKEEDKKRFHYLSYESMIETENIQYFADIFRYKNYGFSGERISWRSYNSSLKRFADFCNDYFLEGYSKENYLQVDRIFFAQFVQHERMDSPATIRNTLSHLKNFLKFLNYNNKKFQFSYSEVEHYFKDRNLKKAYDILEEEKLSKIIRHLSKNKKKLCIFYMSLCYGMERSTIQNLKWTDWSLDTLGAENLNTAGRIRAIPDFLVKDLKELKIWNTKKNYGSEYLFYSKYAGKISSISETGVNVVFDGLAKLEHDEVYRQYSAASIRKALPIFFLKRGAALDEILFFLCIEPSNLNKYVTKEDILAIVPKKEEPSVRIIDILEKLVKKFLLDY